MSGMRSSFASLTAVRGALAMEWLDEHIPHRGFWWYATPFRRLICSAADVSYGWGPDAIDWKTKATRLDRWLHRRLEAHYAERTAESGSTASSSDPLTKGGMT